MYLRDIAVFADETIVDRFPSGFVQWFHRETCCVTDWYASLLWRKVATADTAKVNFVFQELEPFVPTVRQLIDVADVRWFFRFSEYAQSNEARKKRMILDAIQGALRSIAKDRGWDRDRLEECYAAVIARDLNFQGWSKKSWLAPDRKHRARIGFYFGLRMVDFFVGVFDRKGNEIGRKQLGSVAPAMGLANAVLKGAGQWRAGSLFRYNIPKCYFHVPKSWEADL